MCVRGYFDTAIVRLREEVEEEEECCTVMCVCVGLVGRKWNRGRGTKREGETGE